MKIATLVQFDLETLSLHPTHAIVASIGIDALRLSLHDGVVDVEAHDNVCFHLDMHRQQMDGRRIDIDTLQWWLEQDDIARKIMAQKDGRLTVAEAINNIDAFVRSNALKDSRVFVLSSAVGFDMTNIRNLYSSVGYEPSWAHYQEHSQRTLRQLCPKDLLPERGSIAHTADGDAEWQNYVLYSIMRQDAHAASRDALRGFFFGE